MKGVRKNQVIVIGSKCLSFAVVLLLISGTLVTVLGAERNDLEDVKDLEKEEEEENKEYELSPSKESRKEKSMERRGEYLEDLFNARKSKTSDKRQYDIELKGATRTRWMRSLEQEGVDIINYAGQYGYRVKMSPRIKEDIGEFHFVRDVDRVDPLSKVQRGLSKGKIHVFLDGSTRERSPNQDVVINATDREKILKMARRPDVFWVGQHIEPELMDETSSEIVGGFWERWKPYKGPGNYANHLGYNGSNVVVSICDTGIGDGTVGSAGHRDFTGRVVGGKDYTRKKDWSDIYGHGTHCAGLVAGDTYGGRKTTYGNTSYYVGQGVAPEAKLYSQKIFSSSFFAYPDFDELFRHASENGTYVHSNSWGGSTSGRYISYDVIYDGMVRDSNYRKEGEQPMVITVSAGNLGGSGDQSTGSPGNAKNVITVGATENFHPDAAEYGNTRYNVSDPNRIAWFSSQGPTTDGRIKPDVVAPGKGVLSLRSPATKNEFSGVYSEDPHYLWASGTSMSNPITAGASAVVIDWYNRTYGERPSPAMVKALLVNTAKDLDNSIPVPNMKEGWGRVNLPKIVSPDTDLFVKDQTAPLETDERSVYNLKSKDTDEPINISLTWTDHPSSQFNDVHLINDLNLRVYGPEGDLWRGNAFQNGHSKPNTDSQWDHDGDGSDDRNNVVNVFIPEEEVKEGMYSVVIEGQNIAMDSINGSEVIDQDYAIVGRNTERYQGDIPALNVLRPQRGSLLVSGEDTEIEWITGGGDEPMSVDLEYSKDDGDSWNPIEEDISKHSYNWTVPEVDSEDCRIKATITDLDGQKDSSISKAFQITPLFTEIEEPHVDEKLVGRCSEDIEPDVKGLGTEKSVDLWYRLNSSSGWVSIAEGLKEPYTYRWRPPNEASNQTYIKALVKNEKGQSFSSVSGPFKILKRHSTPWSDGMEDTVKNWSHRQLNGGPPVDEWRISYSRFKAGKSSWHSGSQTSDFIPTGDSVLITPAVHLDKNLSGDRARFSFDHFYHLGHNLQGPGDGSMIEVWDNKTEGWNKIEPMGEYDERIQPDTLNPLRERMAYTGSSMDWKRADFDLSNYTGRTVRIRFHIGWDSLYGREETEGWFIDNVYFGEPPEYEVRVDIDDSQKIGRAGEDTEYEIEVSNTGTKDDTYHINSEGNWITGFYHDGEEIDSLTIKGGNTKEIEVKIEVPSKAKEGSEESTKLNIQSKENNSVNETHVLRTEVPYQEVFSEDFEELGDRWDYYREGPRTNRSEPWNRSQNRSFGGEYSMHIGPEPETMYGEGSIIESPLVSLKGEYKDYRLSFHHWYEFSYSYLGSMDGGIIEVWDNVSKNWSMIEPPHGYGEEIVKGYGNPLIEKEVFSSRSMHWVKERFDLSEYSGRTVRIRLYAGWDNLLQGTEGWYIDDLRVGRTPAYGIETQLRKEKGVGTPGDSVSYRFTVNNTGRENDTYGFSTETDWSITIEDVESGEEIDRLYLPRGENTTLKAVVYIPHDAESGNISEGTIKISSQNQTGLADIIGIKTVTPHSRRFESDIDGEKGPWTHQRLSKGFVDDNWMRSDNRSSNLNMSWWSGREPGWLFQGGDTSLESPYISLKGVSSRAEMSFQHWYSFSRNPDGYGDGGTVEIWDNVTGEWEKLSPKRGYPGKITPGFLNPLGGGSGFVGYSDGWVESRFDISKYKGRTIKIRFHLGWDYYSYTRSEGWYIDDVMIGEPADHQFRVEEKKKNRFGEPGSELDYIIELNNTGKNKDRYTLKTTCDWNTTIWMAQKKTDLVEVESGRSKTVKMKVQIPNSAEEGTLKTVQLSIESKNRSSRQEKLHFTAQVYAPVLLVDDDMGTGTENVYKEEMEKNGFRYNYWSVYQHGEIDCERLDDFSVVIWFTGGSDGYTRPTLTAEERDVIGSYIDGGGRLYLSSMMAGLDAYLNGWSEWSEDVLHITLNDIVSSLLLSEDVRVLGKNKDPISHDLPLRLFGNHSYNGLRPNMTIVELKRDAKSIYSFLTFGNFFSELSVGARVEYGESKIVYTGFEFASIGKNRTELIDRIVKWLRDYPNVPMEPKPKGDLNFGTDTDLSVYVSDPLSRDLTVEFYWANGTLIEKVKDVSSGNRTSVSVSGLDYEKVYKWYVEVSNEVKTRISDTWSFTTRIDKTNPSADPGEDRTVFIGETVRFNASGSTDNVGIANYTWSIENETLYGEKIEYNFEEIGVHKVKLTVQDGFDNPDSELVNVTVKLKPDMDSDGMPNDWERKYGLDPRDSSDADKDKDDDGYTNLEEFKAGTDPTDGESHPSYNRDKKLIYFFLVFGVSLSLILGMLLYSRKEDDESERRLQQKSLYPSHPSLGKKNSDEQYSKYRLDDSDRRY